MHPHQYIKTGSDESYTYPNLINIIIPFIEQFKESINKDNITIWCPFDLREDMEIDGVKYFKSNYVKIFEEKGYNVIATHILTGQDFFKYKPDKKWDVIISNPPFKNKKLFFERAISFDKPFALISAASWFNDSGVNNVFEKYQDDFAIIVPNRRAKFFNNKKEVIGKQPSFKAIYFCYKFIRKGIYFVNMDKE